VRGEEKGRENEWKGGGKGRGGEADGEKLSYPTSSVLL